MFMNVCSDIAGSHDHAGLSSLLRHDFDQVSTIEFSRIFSVHLCMSGGGWGGASCVLDCVESYSSVLCIMCVHAYTASYV